MLATLVRDKDIGPRVVPIVPDEARTFGMEGMFRQLGIYSSEGQIYEPEDSDEIAGYRESKEGQVLEEGINEAGAILGVDRGGHRRTARIVRRWFRSTSSIRCSAFSASAISRGRPATFRRADFCLAALRAERR